MKKQTNTMKRQYINNMKLRMYTDVMQYTDVDDKTKLSFADEFISQLNQKYNLDLVITDFYDGKKVIPVTFYKVEGNKRSIIKLFEYRKELYKYCEDYFDRNYPIGFPLSSGIEDPKALIKKAGS